MVIKLDIVINKVMQLTFRFAPLNSPWRVEMHLELILANTNRIHPLRGVSTNDFANLFNAELINIAIVCIYIR
jgi:hypothetical protein